MKFSTSKKYLEYSTKYLKIVYSKIYSFKES